jgi:predicted secreted hydrolase
MSKKDEYYLAMFDGKLGADRNPKNYQRRDDGSHIFQNEEEYYEWWYFDASFSNGYNIVITYHYRNIFLKPMIPSIQLFIYKPDGTKIEKYDLIAPEKATANPNYCDVRMGDSWVKDTGEGYELYMKIDGTGCHLNLKNLVPSWKPGSSGMNYLDTDTGKMAGWVVPVPHARVEGELYLDGETLQVEGDGYHDHNWGNFSLYKTTDFWYWGRIHNEQFAVDWAHVVPLDKEMSVLAPLLIAGKEEIILSTNMLQVSLEDFETDEAFGRRYAKKIQMHADAKGVQFKMILRFQRIIEKLQLPQVTDKAHHYYRFLSDYEMEVNVDGKVSKAKGEMLYELMMF